MFCDDGQLPSGLTLSPGGLISGTPEAAGQYAFVVQVRAHPRAIRTIVFITDSQSGALLRRQSRHVNGMEATSPRSVMLPCS